MARKDVESKSVSTFFWRAPTSSLAVVVAISVIASLVGLVAPSGGAAPVVLDRTQSGTVTLADGAFSATVTIDTVDPSSAFLTYSYRGSATNPDEIWVSGQLSDATTLTFDRYDNNGTVVISWHVAEFRDGVMVQRGVAAVSGTTTDVLISPVDLATSFPLIGPRSDGAAFNADDFVRASLPSSTNLRLTAQDTGTRSVAWQVVSYEEAAVQSGTATLGTAATVATSSVAAVDPSASWLVYSSTSDDLSGDNIGQALVRGEIVDSTTLRFERGNSGINATVQWFVVEFADGTRVQQGSAALPTGVSGTDVGITPSPLDRSIATSGQWGLGGETTLSSAENPGVAWVTTELVDESTLRLTRGDNSATADVGWSVITFPCADSDGDGLCDDQEDADGDADGDPATSPGPDTDGDTLPNYLDADDDGDGIPTASENADPNGDGDPRDALDTNWDGQSDYLDVGTADSSTPVADEQRVSDTVGGFLGTLSDGDVFGRSVTTIGDLDGDGVVEVVVGAPYDDGAASFRSGAVHVLFLAGDGTVTSTQEISITDGGLGAAISSGDEFGWDVADIGDLDGDGRNELLVGAPRNNGSQASSGAVHVLFLNTDGTVRTSQEISQGTGGLTTSLLNDERFGWSVAGIGDLDGDGIPDAAVGEYYDAEAGNRHGAVHVLFLNADGTVKAEQKITEGIGGFVGPLANEDRFGSAVAAVGDVDGDGVVDLAVGAEGGNDVGDTNQGDVYVLRMATDGTVVGETRISEAVGGFTGTMATNERFGVALAGVGDLDGDGVPDLAVGAPGDDDGGTDRGAVHLLHLTSTGSVANHELISNTSGGLTATLTDSDGFGEGISGLGDLDGDGSTGLIVGAPRSDDGGADRGAVHVVDLSAATCSGDSDGDGLLDCEEDANTDADGDPATNPGPDTDGDAVPNHLDADDDGDGIPTVSENADPNGDGDPRDALDADRDGQPDYLDVEAGPSGTPVADEQKISDTAGGLAAVLDDSDALGFSLASIGDVDGDGVVDLAIGARGDDDGGPDRGAVYVLLLNADGSVRAEQKISDTAGGLAAVLDDSDQFGHSVAGLGDVDGDGVVDLAVGAYGDDDGGSGRGAVYVLLLNADGSVRAEQKISDTAGGLAAVLDDSDGFGSSVGAVGDVDGDGVVDLAVGAPFDDDGGSGRGALYVLLLNADGSVRAEQKISDTAGGLAAVLDDLDQFGHSVAGLGDVDGDGVVDLAVGAYLDGDGGSGRGALYVLLLNADGSVRAEQKISDTAGGLNAVLDNVDLFGSSVAGLGDVDGDGVVDLAVGAYLDGDGGSGRGAVYVLLLNADGSVRAEQKISDTAGGLAAVLDDSDGFGHSVAGLGDLDGDGALNLAVGALSDDDGGSGRGAVYVLDLTALLDSDGDGLWDHEEDANTDLDNDPATNPGPDTDGDTTPNYLDADDDGDGVPTASENADPNGDGDPRDALDADRDGQPDHLDVEAGRSSTPIADEQKISDIVGGFGATLDNADGFGLSAASIGDLDGDGVNDIAVGAPFDDDGGFDRGAIYVLFMNVDGTVRAEQKISDTVGGLLATLDDGDQFGRSIASTGDLDGDGIGDIAVGARFDDDGGADRGAIHILFLRSNGTVRAEQKISSTTGGFGTGLDTGDRFGGSVTRLGDLDGDGINDIAVGADLDDDGGLDRGAVYVLFMNTDGTVRAKQKISDTAGGLLATLDNADEFGSSVSGIGDVDGDGIPDIAVGAPRDDDGGTDRGAAHVLFLDTDGTVTSEQKISDTAGGLLATLDNSDYFAGSLSGVGDLDGDGTPDLAVGALYDDDGGADRGAAHVLFLDTDGTVTSEQKISSVTGGLTGPLDNFDVFGSSIVSLGDLDGDRALDLAVGAFNDGDGGTNRGAVYVVDLSLANSAPVLDNTGTMALTTITEDDATNNGNTVAEIIASAGGDRITDADGDPEGFLIEDFDGYDEGLWQFSIDAGATWTTVNWYREGTPLRSTDRIRFVPQGLGAQTSTLTVRAWDQTSDTAGVPVRGYALGDPSAYSTATETVNVTVTAVNDAPTFGKPPVLGWFGSDTAFTSWDLENRLESMQALVQLSDGSVVVGGFTTTADDPGNDQLLLVKFDPDGKLDETFGVGGYVLHDLTAGDDQLSDLAVQPDGKLVAVGRLTSLSDGFIARFDADGSLDTTFAGGVGWASFDSGAGNDFFNGVAIQADGRIVAAGSAASRLLVARYNSNGTLDTTFDGDGFRYDPAIRAIEDVAIQADGGIVLGTWTSNVGSYDPMAVVRLTTTGALDTTFDGDGIATVDFGFTTNTYGVANAIAIQPDGAIVATGEVVDFSAADWRDQYTTTNAARFLPTGALDPSFGGGTGYVSTPILAGSSYYGMNDLAIQADGAIVVAGEVDLGTKGQSDPVIARYTAAGVLDTSFGEQGLAFPVTGRYWNYLTGVTVLPDGDILTTGYGEIGGSYDVVLVRFDSADGSTVVGPTANALDGEATVVIGGPAATLDTDLAVFDAELIDIGSWAGTWMTIERQGGPDPVDEFVAGGDLSTLTEGGDVILGGTTIGTVTTNSGGALRLDFTANATQARVDQTLESIAYATAAGDPGDVNTFAWTFSDGNAGAQGPGGEAFATGTSTVTLAATTVNSTGDAGDLTPGDGVCDTGGTNSQGDPECTLRAALTEADASPAMNAITFAMPTTEPGYNASGPAWRLNPATDYPTITTSLTIDATTQSGFTSRPVVEIYGAGAVTNGLRLASSSSSTTIRGFAIGGFSNNDLNISGNDHTIAGNHFGLTVDGIAGFPVRTGFASIYIAQGTGTTIGGAIAADRNVVANAQNGIVANGSLGASNVTVSGNYIGVDLSGNAVALNTFDGVRIQNGVTGAVIGGPTAADGNVIASGQDGVEIDNETTDGAIVRNNLIGIGADRTTATTIGGSGVFIWGGPDSTEIRSNIVGNATLIGIEIDGASTGTVITGNLVGVDAGGNAHPIQENGILFEGGATSSTLGGTTPSDANIISNAGVGLGFTAGVAVTSGQHAVIGNSIFDNAGIGIDIHDGSTPNLINPNDAGDVDSGPNDLLNFPVLGVPPVGADTLDFDLDAPAGAYRIELFANPTDGADPSGYGEGELLVHAETITHGGTGLESFTLTGIPAFSAGDVVTATATEDLGGGTYGATSEFSLAVASTGCAVDSDGDGLFDCEEDSNTDADDDPSTNPGPDTDGDTLANYLDADDDGDGIPTASENADPNGDGDPRDALDIDRDGEPDYLDVLISGATDGRIDSVAKISAVTGGLTGPGGNAYFGFSVAPIGDVDRDGIEDLVVGSPRDGDGVAAAGAVYVLFMNTDGTVRASQKISALEGGFAEPVALNDNIGTSVAGIGDIDGDGTPDIAVGALGDDGGGNNGEVHVIFLNTDGTVKASQKISETDGNGVDLDPADQFAFVTGLGDLDGDGINDLAVGAPYDDDGAGDAGAVYILFLNADGTVKASQKISNVEGGHPNTLAAADIFGRSVAGLGDVDGDGVNDLAVGAPYGDGVSNGEGYVEVLLLNTDGTVREVQRISDDAGGLNGALNSNDYFGFGVGGVGDLDGDGVPDLVVGAPSDDDGGANRGALYVLFLASDGTVVREQLLSELSGGLEGQLADGDYFGHDVAGIGDLDGDGVIDLAAGSPYHTDGGINSGAIRIMFSRVDLPTAAVQVNDTGDASDSNPGDGLCETASPGVCTLRAAIQEANASSAVDIIEFAIPQSDPNYVAFPTSFTITPATPFPIFTERVTIDGTSQAEYSNGLPVIVLDGSLAGTANVSGLWFEANSHASEVRALTIHSFDDFGIRATNVGHLVVDDSVIGLEADGVTAAGQRYGIYTYLAGYLSITDNVISANEYGAALYNDSSDATITGNLFGTDHTGLLDRGNVNDGLVIVNNSVRAVIGGAGAGEANVLSGNGGAGLYFATTANSQAFVEANRIGVGADGSTVIPNDIGIELNFAGNLQIIDNLIGPQATAGISISNGDDVVVQGNSIGTDPTGFEVWPIGGDAIAVLAGVDRAVIGGTGPGEGNLIRNATGAGVALDPLAGSGTAVLGNTISGNGGLAIDLGADGVTANDAGDVDTGPNGLLNHPVITAISQLAGTVTVDVDLDVPAGDYRIELFENPGGADPSGFGEGEVFAHGETISHTGTGVENFTVSYPGTSVRALAATATSDLGAGTFRSSSEFSAVFQSIFVVNSTGDAADLTPGDGRCTTGGTNAIALPECTLRAAIEEANALGEAAISFDMPFADPGQVGGVWTISPASGFDQITVPITIDGTTQAGFTSTPVVQLDGTSAGATDAIDLQPGAAGSIIRSLAIGNYAQDAIDTGADNTTIVGNHLGVDAAGTSARPVGGTVVYIDSAADVLVGGTTSLDRNVIVGSLNGILVVNGSTDTIISGNFIGADVTGNAGLGTISSDGIRVEAGSLRTVIGGSAPGAGNVIGGAGDDGIDIRGADTRVEGNSIGIGLDGIAAIDLQDDGISIDASGVDVIDNVIGNPGDNGIETGGTTSDLTIQGNVFGSNATLTVSHAPGRENIQVNGTATSIRIGGVDPGDGNTLVNTPAPYPAISVRDDFADDVAILGNVIDSDFLSIDLAEDGFTANDVLDADGGANDLMNFPDLAVTSSTTSDSITWAVGLDVSLDVPAGDYRIEVFSNDQPGYGGAGNGQQLVHAFTVTHPGGGAQVFPTSYAGPEPLSISATATEEFGGGAFGSTSEMSPAVPQLPTVAVVNSTGDAADLAVNDGVCSTGALNAEGAPECTLRAAIEHTNRTTNGTIDFAVPTSDPGYIAGDAYWVIDPGPGLPALRGRGLTIDGASQPTYTGAFPVIHLRGAGGDAIDVTTSDVTLRDFSIGNPQDDAVQVRGERALLDRMWIGVDPLGEIDGSPGAGNEGIILYSGSNDVLIRDSRVAGFDSGVISNSGTMSVTITGSEIFDNRNGGVAFVNGGTFTLLGNSIHDNEGLGFSLGTNDGIPLPNDVGDGDNGPNGLLNHPVLTSATLGAGTADVDYTIDVPAGTYRLEFFDSDRPDPTGFGEGQTFLSAETIVHPGGSANYTATVPADAGAVITATATPDLGGGTYGGTSEFSNASLIGIVFVNSTGDSGDLAVGDGLCDTGGANADGRSECTLRAAIQEANASAAVDIIHFQIPETDPGFVAGVVDRWRITPASTLGFSSDISSLDATTQPGWVDQPIIEVDGTYVIAGVDRNGFLLADGMTLSGLSITNWLDFGVVTGSTGATLSANWFGVAPDGSVAPNGGDVIAYGSTNGLVVGGSAPADGNLFAAGGGNDGVLIVNTSTDVLVENNRFGVTADGLSGLGSTTAEQLSIADDVSGVVVRGNQFGDSPNAAIAIAGNASGIDIVGNVFGTDTTGTATLPNAQALYTATSGAVRFGGTGAGEGNLVRNVLFDAVLVDTGQTGPLSVLGNSISGSGELALDLLPADATANDLNDADSGPNDLLNFPEIASATTSGGTTSITFTLDVPAGDYRIEAFANPSGADPTGFGEGETFLGAATITHLGGGSRTFELSVAGVGVNISMTATQDLGGGTFGATSEFSAVVTPVVAATVEDISVRRSDLIAAGGLDPTVSSPGVAGAGIAFDGGLERLVGPPTDLTSNALTISAWVELDTAGTDPRVISKGSGAGAIYELLIDDGTGEAVARLDIGGVVREVRGGTVVVGALHHLVATWNGTTIVLYVNGVAVDSIVASGALTVDLGEPLVIGNTSTGSFGLDGTIDQVELAHAATSSSEIAARYRNGSDPAAYLSIGAAQSAAPAPWTTSGVQTRSGAAAAAAPLTGSGVDAWLTAIGLDEPGVEFDSWWWVSDPATSEVAAGTRTGLVPTDQFDVSADSAGLDLAVLSAADRFSSATSPTTVAAGSWQRVTVRTDEAGVASVRIDGVEAIGATALSGFTSGSVGFRATDLDGVEQWFIDDVRVRRLVSDEPTTSLSGLERN